VRATIYQIDSTIVCVFHVPKGSAGKKLAVGFEVTTRDGLLTTIASGLMQPKLIRR
jgi:hypothetical protein